MHPDLSDEQLLASLKRLDRLADLSDSKFRIPFTRIRFGLDSLIGLIPVVGETIGLVISLYILMEASKLGVPRALKAKMLGNILLDWLVGLVPVVGDIADIAFKANVRNMKLLVEHIDEKRQRRRSVTATAQNKLLTKIVLVLLALSLIGLSVYALWRYVPV